MAQIIRILLFVIAVIPVSGQDYLSFKKVSGGFPMVVNGKSAPLFVDASDYPGVIRAAKSLQSDIQKVSGNAPAFSDDKMPDAAHVIIIGTLGKSKVIDALVKAGKLNVDGLSGKWEKFHAQVINEPFRGIKSALVITGSDKRGSIYGIYDLSSEIGVSPWYWWADVPVEKHPDIYVNAGLHTLGEPKVKYRGIFINDEAPALSGWTKEKFGGFNSEFYVNVFELILRMKGNYLWPAMWGNAFQVDDPLNPVLADEFGVVIGTSHHEPLMRAHDEWRRFGKGKWNYVTNDSTLREFWRQSMKERGARENIVSVGMRGDGDEPMTRGTATELLERIVKDQRQIIEETSGKPASETPQLWALYKEVQDYYDKGMRVPDDVTLLLCDDNWGNIRKLPAPGAPKRKGGYGIYYHFDYVGGPRNYKWLNTNLIPRIWEQMHLAYEYDAREIWIVNVGDIKPVELPTAFFLDYAWNPDRWNADNIDQYTRLWAEKTFGLKEGREAGDLLHLYTKYNARRKPELLSSKTYSLLHYREWENVVKDYKTLAARAQKQYDQLETRYKDAYYQLVLFPILACSNLNEMYYYTALNQLYYQQGRATANLMAEEVERTFRKDEELTHYFHTGLANGKWNHMMSQTHIGYKIWQQPEKNAIPPTQKNEIPAVAEPAVMMEGSATSWGKGAVSEEFRITAGTDKYIEIFNKGLSPFDYKIQGIPDWLSVSEPSGKIAGQRRLYLKVISDKLKETEAMAQLSVIGPEDAIIKVNVKGVKSARAASGFKGFIERDGVIAVEASHFQNAVNSEEISWKVIPEIGRTGSGVAVFPVTAKSAAPAPGSPHLAYDIWLTKPGEITVSWLLSPTLEFNDSRGLKIAVSLDDEKPVIIDIHEDRSLKAWEKTVADNIKTLVSKHSVSASGKHTLKYWFVDPGVVLQKIVIDHGGLQPSYLGPPETKRNNTDIKN